MLQIIGQYALSAGETSSEIVIHESPDKDNEPTPPGSTKRPKRKVLPDHVPIESVICDLIQGNMTCKVDGSALVKIGEDVREELMCRPAKLWVRRHRLRSAGTSIPRRSSSK